MKPWQRTEKNKSKTARPTDPTALIGHMYHAFTLRRRYWEVFGKKRPGICQFRIEGSSLPAWFVELGEKGGVIKGGEHPLPNAVWSSHADDFVAMLRGDAGNELFDQGRVRLEGDLDLMDGLFQGLSARI